MMAGRESGDGSSDMSRCGKTMPSNLTLEVCGGRTGGRGRRGLRSEDKLNGMGWDGD